MATSFAWEGYDIARHHKPFLFINGLTNNVDSRLPAVWSQMMARARTQDEVTMVIAGDSQPEPSNLIWDSKVYVPKLEKTIKSAYNKKETSPDKYVQL